MHNRSKQLFIVVTTLLTAAACGRAKPAIIQPRGQVEPPAFPVEPSQALQLTDASKNVTFSSNVLLWTELPPAERVRDILEQTKQTRVIRSQALDYIEKTIIPAKKALDVTNLRGKDAAAQIEAARDARDLSAVRTYIHSVAGGYVEEQLKELATAKVIADADAAHGNLMWEGYCDAKLLEFAVSPQLDRAFTQRPTPTAMCEAYYARQKYFADAQLCAAAPAGRDYFACIWLSGVAKSTYFVDKDKKCISQPETKAKALTSWVGTDGNGQLRTLLHDTKSVRVNDPQTFRGLVLDSVFGGSNFGRPILTAYPVLGKCRDMFFKRATPSVAGKDVDTAGVPYWAQANVTTLISIGEDDVENAAFRLWPRSANAARDQGLAAKLQGVIRPFSRRESINRVQQPTYSDDQLNIVLAPPALKTSAEFRNAVEAGPLLPKLADFDTPAIAELKKATSAGALAAANQTLTAAIKTFRETDAVRIRNNITEVLKVGIAPDAAVYVNTFKLTIGRRGAELAANLYFDLNARPLVACVNTETNAACGFGPDGKAEVTPGTSLKFDKAANLISFQFDLGSTPERKGFPQAPRLGRQFNDIPLANLVDRRVLLEVYGNQLGSLPIITGNMYIVDGETRLYSGSLTGDAYGQVSGELQKANGLSF